MAGNQLSTSVSIIDSLHGYQALSLTEYNTSAAASICAGSVVEIAGAFFTFSGDEAIEASTWTSIVTGNTAYIALTPAGTAGSQTVTATYTSTAPAWRDDFQGWYASAASNVRIIGSVYKAEATNYAQKYLWGNEQNGKYRFTSSLSVLGAVSASSSLSVSGAISASSSLTVSGDISALSSLSVSGTFTSNNLGSRAYSSIVLATGATSILSAGRYYTSATPSVYVDFQDSGSTWRTLLTGNYGNYIISDGSNVRLRNAGTSTTTTYILTV